VYILRCVSVGPLVVQHLSQCSAYYSWVVQALQQALKMHLLYHTFVVSHLYFTIMSQPLERPFTDIVTSIRYWVIHSITIPSLFIAGWIFVSTGLAYDLFGTPRPNEYFTSTRQEVPLLTDRFNALEQMDLLVAD